MSMMPKPLISVIIPVYNAEQYLKECVGSVLTQTYSNLEVILVDDESPDGSPLICDEYAANDSRVRVIHKKNGGTSDARNAGLDIAQGEYITFLDCDDYIDDNLIEYLYINLIVYNADISCCDFVKLRNAAKDLKKIRKYRKQPTVLTREQAVKMYCDFSLYPNVWAKLYNKNIFSAIRYPKGVAIVEDSTVIIDVFMAAAKIVYSSSQLYYHRIHENSLFQNDYQKTSRIVLEMLESRFERIKNEYPALTGIVQAHLFREYVRAYQRIALKRNGYDKTSENHALLQLLFRQIRNCKVKEILTNSYLSAAGKIILVVLKTNKHFHLPAIVFARANKKSIFSRK